MLMNLQTLELFSQALKEDNCFYACDHYLFSYLGKFLLFKNLFDLFFAVSSTEPHFRPARERNRHYVNNTLFFYQTNLSSSSYIISSFLSFELRKSVCKVFKKSLHFFQSYFSPTTKKNKFCSYVCIFCLFIIIDILLYLHF